MWGYSTVDTPTSVLIIGGRFHKGITQFKEDKWSRLGNLHQRRYAHESIIIGRDIIIVGGFPITRFVLKTLTKVN